MSVTRIVRRQLGWSRARGRSRRTAATRSLAFALALMGPGAASARASAIEDRNLWGIVSLTGPLLGREAEAGRWRYTFDAPQRFGDDLHRFSQGVWRADVGFPLTPRWSFWAGYSHTDTDTPVARSEAGYLHQLVHRPGGTDRHNHVLAISLAFAFR